MIDDLQDQQDQKEATAGDGQLPSSRIVAGKHRRRFVPTVFIVIIIVMIIAVSTRNDSKGGGRSATMMDPWRCAGVVVVVVAAIGSIVVRHHHPVMIGGCGRSIRGRGVVRVVVVANAAVVGRRWWGRLPSADHRFVRLLFVRS